MLTYEYDFDNNKHGCNVEIEIDYDAYPPEYMGHHCTFGGSLDLVDVRVTAIEGYDEVGNIWYRLKRDEITPSWLPDLDAAAYEWVETEIDRGGTIEEELWSHA